MADFQFWRLKEPKRQFLSFETVIFGFIMVNLTNIFSKLFFFYIPFNLINFLFATKSKFHRDSAIESYRQIDAKLKLQSHDSITKKDNNIFLHKTNLAKNALFVIYELKNLGFDNV